MHIPDKEKKIQIIPFLDELNMPNIQPDYNTDHWLYVPNYYTEYRYILGTIGVHPLICVGINPSTAAPNDLDNTLKSVDRIASGNGFDSFIMFNVYAQRATNPNDLDTKCNEKLHEQNMKAFDYILSLDKTGSSSIWAAWGTLIEKRSYLTSCLYDMISIGQKHNANWFTAGAKSKKGHPHHPLYLKKDSTLESFDIEMYLSTLNLMNN